MSNISPILEELPVLQRLALAYAPASVREPTLALFALDTRLGAILRGAREPMLAQLRLAWWREQLRSDPATWPSGDPLLAALQSWAGGREALAGLVGLVDGWEALTGAAPLPAAALDSLADARGDAFAALAVLVGAGRDREAARRLGRGWALADLASRLSHPDERQAAARLAAAEPPGGTWVSRRMRPLAVLSGLARRRSQGDGLSRTAVLAALRIGLLGR